MEKNAKNLDRRPVEPAGLQTSVLLADAIPIGYNVLNFLYKDTTYLSRINFF